MEENYSKILVKKDWKDTYPEYNKLLHCDKKLIDASLNQYFSGLLLILWKEVSKLFPDFLKKIPRSQYKNMKAVFSRRDYQSNSGNLVHAHIIIAVDWDKLSEEESFLF